jgi:hypothetical protein
MDSTTADCGQILNPKSRNTLRVSECCGGNATPSTLPMP